MALAHKGLQSDRRPWRFTEKDRIAFSGQDKVPVLVDNERVISDSWHIAQYLDDQYPTTPQLLGDLAEHQRSEFINLWADHVLLPAIGRIIVLDILNCLAPIDKAYFRNSREKRFGTTLESVAADCQSNVEALQIVLTPLRKMLSEQDYLSGTSPRYGDYCVFGMFMWARCTSKIELVPRSDPIIRWRERLLDAFDGMARSARLSYTLP